MGLTILAVIFGASGADHLSHVYGSNICRVPPSGIFIVATFTPSGASSSAEWRLESIAGDRAAVCSVARGGIVGVVKVAGVFRA